MELKELSNNPIEVKYTESSVTLTTVPYGNDNKRRSLMRRNRKVVPKVEILLFDADEIKELQTIAQQIYKAKRQEREQLLSDNESKKSIKTHLTNIIVGILKTFK